MKCSRIFAVALILTMSVSSASAQQGECNIKGNVSTQGERIYHMPGDKYYNETRISASHGERTGLASAGSALRRKHAQLAGVGPECNAARNTASEGRRKPSL